MNPTGFSKIMSGGDWPVFYQRAIEQFSFFPYVWSPTNGNGLGQNVSFVLGYKSIFATSVKFFSDLLNLPWGITEKLVFFLPFWLLTIFSSYFLSKQIFENKWQRVVSVLIFSTNTYSLMLVGGGQMGVAMAYAMSPLIVGMFIKIIRQSPPSINVKLVSSVGLIFGFQLMLDPRISIVTLFACLILYFVFIIREHKGGVMVLVSSSAAILIAILINLFWILPFMLAKDTGLADAYTSAGIVKFLSFATFENTISLLHPNWPENVFGKVGFMKPEFLVIPILAFFALIFTRSKHKVNGFNQGVIALAISLVALFGAFLAKGTNLPFGDLYFWASQHVPMFTIFRDSTKWYLLIAIAYSILIPLVLFRFTQMLQSRYKTGNLLFFLFIAYWLFTIRPLFLGQVGGTFKPSEIPPEYIKLEEHIVNQNEFFRTFWIPYQSRYGYFSNTNPYVSSYEFINKTSISSVLKYLSQGKAQNELRDAGVKYVIVPYDAKGEIYLEDRKYSEEEYEKTIAGVKKIPWLTEVKGFNRIKVFRLSDPKKHFSIDGTGRVNSHMVSPVEYEVGVEGAQKGEVLTFSESFSDSWVIERLGGGTINSTREGKLNSFMLPKSGSYKFKVYYEPQKYVSLGLIVSSFTLILTIGLIVMKRKK